MPYPTLFPPQVNSPPTELSAAIDAVQLTINVVDGSILPDEPCPLTIGSDVDGETVLMTSKAGNVLTVTREFEGIAKAWPIGEAIGRNLTSYDHAAIIEWLQTMKLELEDMLKGKKIDIRAANWTDTTATNNMWTYTVADADVEANCRVDCYFTVFDTFNGARNIVKGADAFGGGFNIYALEKPTQDFAMQYSIQNWR